MTEPSDVTARLVMALEKLPTDYDDPDGYIPYRFCIPEIAKQLARMKRHSLSTEAAREQVKDLETLAADALSLSLRVRDLPRAGDVSLILDATGGFQFSELADVLHKLGDAARSVAIARAIPVRKIGR